MFSKKKERRNTTSCGTLTYRIVDDDEEKIEILLVHQDVTNDRWGVQKKKINIGETFE